MTCDPLPEDILLRLSLVEGFSARDLSRITAASAGPLPFCAGGTADHRKACAVIASREAGERIDRIREQCRKKDIRIITLASEDYPPLLRAVPDAPLVLYREGAAVPGNDGVAIVGSRFPTGAGGAFARELAQGLAAGGWTVVSGMARGVDSAAHEGALKDGGKTVAVLGCGVDVVYPPEAWRLRERIVERGAVLSEYPPGTQPLRHRFPARNRIISGISRGVVVAEAQARSGALITARLALDQGREVMAVPGNPLFPHTAGSNRLLRDGATPVTGPWDVASALGGTPRTGPDADRERRILEFLGKERHVDEIALGLGIPLPELLPCLLEMELGKLLERRAGAYYKKMSDSQRGRRR
jgi:DNA processing protein